MLSEPELAYLDAQPLMRLATVDADGQPTVDAVSFEFADGRFYVGGMNLLASRKYKNVAAGNRKVSLIVDDLETTNPWKPRGIRVHGEAAIVEREGRFGADEYLAITPSVSWSWGIEDREYFRDGRFTPKRAVWQGHRSNA